MRDRAHSLHESGEHSVAWKRRIINQIRRQFGFAPPVKIIRRRGHGPQFVFAHTPAGMPLEVRFEVLFEREFTEVRGVPTTKLREASDSAWPTSIVWGDGDKLERNLWDALTQSGLIEDDRLVVGWAGRKRWARAGEEPGLRCVVTEAPEEAL